MKRIKSEKEEINTKENCEQKEIKKLIERSIEERNFRKTKTKLEKTRKTL